MCLWSIRKLLLYMYGTQLKCLASLIIPDIF